MNTSKINVDVSEGQTIKISLVNEVEPGIFKRCVWLEVKSNDDAVISIDGSDMEVLNLWERSDDELPETEER